MIWLTWRQFRFPAAVVFGAAVLLALMLFAAGVPAAGDQALELLSNERGDVQLYTFVDDRDAASRRRSSACSGARRWSRASSRPARTGSSGTRASPARAGW